MPYIFIKNILESLLLNFQCPQCQSKTNETAIQITAISSHGMDVHVHCHVCNTHSQLNAEINTMAAQMASDENGKKFLEEFLKKGGIMDATVMNQKNNTNSIKAEDIEKLDENIKNAKTIEDLMK